MKWHLFFIFFSILSGPKNVLGAERNVSLDFIMNDRHDQLNSEYNSPSDILKRAVMSSCKSCDVKSISIEMSKSREVVSIATMSSKPNVFVGGISAERESLMRIVPINIDSGISGIRVLLTSEAGKKKLSSVLDIDSFRKLKIGQVAGWPDAIILNEIGMNVELTNNLDNLFAMLIAGRFDAVLWSAAESFPNVEYLKSMGIYVSRDYKVCYPSGKFFYVAKDDLERYKLLWDGLKILEARGDIFAANENTRKNIEKQFSKGVKVINLKSKGSDFRMRNPCVN